ncbi:hypothetical protein CMI47_15610, partial [Candidatus Pacearchaeota archaeon]|nr:hypothetical protein [Candidatus Pacearchaeota archaeon]
WGACCYAGGLCKIERSESDCTGNEGIWQGIGSLCTPGTICPVGLSGACCVDDTEECFDTSWLVCQDVHHGTFMNGESCASNPCVFGFRGVGSCCVDGRCFQLTERECLESGGSYIESGVSCDSIQCSSPNYDRTYTEEVSVYKKSSTNDGDSFEFVAKLPYPYNANVDSIQETSYGNFLNAISGNCFDLEEYNIAINENGTLLSVSGYTLLDNGVRRPYILTWYREDYSGYNWTLVQDTRFVDWGDTIFNNGSEFKGVTVNRGRVLALAYQINNDSTKIFNVNGFDRENPGSISMSVILDAINPQSKMLMTGIHSFDVTVGYVSVVSNRYDVVSIIKETVDKSSPENHWTYDILGENHTDLSVLKGLSNVSYDFYSDNSVNNVEMPNCTHVKIKNFKDSGICLITHGRDKNMSIDVYMRGEGETNYGTDQSPLDWTVAENSLPQNPSRVYQTGLDRSNMIRGFYCKHISESSGLCLLSDPRFGSLSQERGRIYPYLYLGGESDDEGYNFIFCHTKNMAPLVNGSYSSGIEYEGRNVSNLFGFSCFGYEDSSGFYISALSCDPSSGGFVSFYKFNSTEVDRESLNDSSGFRKLQSKIISSYALDISYDRWDKKFKSSYLGFDSSEVHSVSSTSLYGGELNIHNGKIDFSEDIDGGSIILRSTDPEGDTDGAEGNEDDQSNISLELIAGKSQSIYTQFGILFHDDGFGGSHGDTSQIKLSDSKISAIANSVTGVFELNDTLTKYDNIKVDIKGAAFKERGSAPHVVLEDTFEGINSGLPSFLSQVQQMNILRSGLALKKKNPYDFDNIFIPYQSNYSLSCDHAWYDKFNSTVDFSLQKKNKPLDISLSFPSTVFEKEEDSIIWVGGPEGIIEVSGIDYSVSVPSILSEYDIENVIKIRRVGSEILILSLDYLLIINEETNDIEVDPIYGVTGRPNDVNRMFNGIYIICTDNGIYSRTAGDALYIKDYGQDFYSTGTFDKFFILEDISGFMFAISENTISITSNGKIWGSYSSPLPNTDTNKLFKFRGGHLLLTNFGTFYDNGTLLEENYSLELLKLLGPESTGSENSAVRANDAGAVVEISEDGTVLQSELFVAISDGSYSISTSSLDTFEHDSATSGLSSIHKVIRFQGNWLVFSFDNFKFIDDTNIYRLSTGLRI